MDSLSQIVLGAACGEAVLGRKVGNKALLWGAIGGTIPDLDVILQPLFHPVDGLFVHRGYSHSLIFAFFAAPVFGWLIHKLYKGKHASFREWTLLMFFSIFTHPLLDAFTGYGTPLFLPFSDYRVDINSVFIIDPLYTLPLAFSLIMVMRARNNIALRRKWNRLGLILSCGYLAFTLVNQQVMSRTFTRALEKEGIAYTRHMSYPTPFNNILWGFIAETENGYYMSYRSWFDTSDVQFSFVPSNKALIEEMKADERVQKLITFSKGYYCITQDGQELCFSDIRFGKAGGWSLEEADFVFSFMVRKDPQGRPVFERGAWQKARMSSLSSLWKRIKGV
ncbi:MAG: metal-dependent hydrolase [Bacteroidota bacterium]